MNELNLPVEESGDPPSPDRVCGAMGCTSTYDIRPVEHPQQGTKWLCPTHREDYMADVDDWEHP